MKLKTLEQILKVFRRQVAEAGSQKQWADRHGISTSYVGDVYHERKEPGELILTALGYRRKAVFEQIEIGNDHNT